VLGLWAGEHGDGEGAKYWLRVLSEIKNRGVRDVCMLVCDGLKGLPDAVGAVWEKTIVQTCIVHLLRNSFKYASKRDWAQIAKDLKPVYTAASEAGALDRFAEFSGKRERRYPAIIRLRENAWAEFVPFLQFDREIRTVICTTDENVNWPGGGGCGHGAAWPQLPDNRRPAASVKVERPEGPNDLDRGEDRGSVGLVAGAADRRAKSRTRDWKSCRAA
jgi:Transposase, Mutator family